MNVTIQETGLKEHFSVQCPALGANVVLLKETWHGHILNPITGHPYMKHKTDLVKRAVQGVTNINRFFRYGDIGKNEWFVDHECPDFKPLANYLRVAFKRLDTGVIIITSAYKMERGILNYEP